MIHRTGTILKVTNLVKGPMLTETEVWSIYTSPQLQQFLSQLQVHAYDQDYQNYCKPENFDILVLLMILFTT